MQILQEAQHAPLHLARLLLRGMTHPPGAADQECLARLGLDKPKTFAERMYRALVSAALAESRAPMSSIVVLAKARTHYHRR